MTDYQIISSDTLTGLITAVKAAGVLWMPTGSPFYVETFPGTGTWYQAVYIP